MEVEDLARFAQACLATLAAAYKHQSLSHQVASTPLVALSHHTCYLNRMSVIAKSVSSIGYQCCLLGQ